MFLHRKKNRGFTLIELMVVLAILGIMAAIVVPNFKQYLLQRRLNGAARQIMSDLMSARMKAITQNRKVKVFFSGSNHQYTVCDDANGDGTVGSGEGTVQVRDIQYDYPGVTYTATADPIFNKNGTAAVMATVTVSNPSGSKNVSVAITGRVSIQ